MWSFSQRHPEENAAVALLVTSHVLAVRPWHWKLWLTFRAEKERITIWMYGKVCLCASVVVAYTNDGYLRDAYR
jgi:hypothetical protein